MRRPIVLDALFPEVRQDLLAATLLSADKWWYLSELAAHLGTSPSSLQRELDSLTRSGILERRVEGRRTYYRARRDSAVFEELRALLSKTAGIVPAFTEELRKFSDRLTWVALYGSVARGEETATSDIDLLVVGEVGADELLPVLRRLEGRFGREVNVKRYSQKEFRAKLHSGDHFLKSVISGKKISLVGSFDELAEIS